MNRNIDRRIGTQIEEQKYRYKNRNIDRRIETQIEEKKHIQKSRNINRRIETQIEEQTHIQKNRNIDRRIETQIEEQKHRQKNRNINRRIKTQTEEYKHRIPIPIDPNPKQCFPEDSLSLYQRKIIPVPQRIALFLLTKYIECHIYNLISKNMDPWNGSRILIPDLKIDFDFKCSDGR